jgi:predicted enzyme involved in methoxymalonyl-ACP biosynthesis
VPPHEPFSNTRGQNAGQQIWRDVPVMLKEMEYPFDAQVLLTQKRRLKRLLLEQTKPRLRKKIAILGGSTTAEIRDMLELFMLHGGISVEFYESEYNQFFEEAVFQSERLTAFSPDLVYIHTTVRNVLNLPEPRDDAPTAAGKLDAEFERFRQVWLGLHARVGCAIVQNNFELPLLRHFGNIDCSCVSGTSHFITQLNLKVAEFARQCDYLHVSDINHLSARLGLDQWFDDRAWFGYKYALNVALIPHLAHNVASLAMAIFGMARKCLALDLDNTLWGGVIGDDGVENIQIGPGGALAEAHTALQAHIKNLGARGVVLAVC